MAALLRRPAAPVDEEPIGGGPPQASDSRPSVAVLPFVNMSDDKEKEYFADGMTEDIITGLSASRHIAVKSRTSTFAYKGQSPDLRTLGKDLGVEYIVPERAPWALLVRTPSIGGAGNAACFSYSQNFAFGSVVTNDWDANSTWQLLSALTHNLARDFQMKTGLATPRKNTRKRTYRYSFRSMRTLRFLLVHIPGRIARPQGRSELRIAAAPSARKRIQGVIDAIAA